MVHTKSIFHGGICFQIPSALSLAAIALRHGASFYGVSSKIFPVGFGTFHAVFKSFSAASNFQAYVQSKYNINLYKQYTQKSVKLNQYIHSVSVPILELVRNRKFYKSFPQFYNHSEEVFHTNTNLYQKKRSA